LISCSWRASGGGIRFGVRGAAAISSRFGGQDVQYCSPNNSARIGSYVPFILISISRDGRKKLQHFTKANDSQ
ncbi:MAG TPA: hypothetical protein VNZ25_01145, partial [Candidatus Angelobacter sp.]|nr:hypothetical protein [Candidatus Angelobacter sp.]